MGGVKGEFDALERVGIVTNCDVATQLAQARPERETAAAKLKRRGSGL